MKTLRVTSLLIASLFVVSAGMAAPRGKGVPRTTPRVTYSNEASRTTSIETASGEASDKAVSKTPPRKIGPRGKTR